MMSGSRTDLTYGGGAPLLGKRIVITRARSQAGELVHKLEQLGAKVIEFPTIEIQPPDNSGPLDEAIKTLRKYDWLIFTSANGVERFFDRARDLGISPAGQTTIRFAAIGPETAKRLRDAGIEGCIVPKVYQAEGLLEALGTEIWRGKRILIPRAAQARDILPETLRSWGASVDVVETYRTVLPAFGAAARENPFGRQKPHVITFTSSSTVANFARIFSRQTPARILSGVAVACIGQITQRTAEDLGIHTDILATESTMDGLVVAVVQFFARSDRP